MLVCQFYADLNNDHNENTCKWARPRPRDTRAQGTQPYLGE